MAHHQSPREIATAIFMAGVDRVRPSRAVAGLRDNTQFVDDLAAAARIIVVGGGKAGAGMAAAFESEFAECLDRMIGTLAVPTDTLRPTRMIRLFGARPAGVNEPTAAAAAAANEMVELARSATSDDVVVVLLSGGASALLPMPSEGVSLADKIEVTRRMSGAGADIGQLNCVRKHLSRIKGGRLAEAAANARRVWGLVISDVVDDPLDVIASGPTVSDPTTYADALRHLRQLGLLTSVPHTVVRCLERGAQGELPETLKYMPPNVRNVILARNADALAAADTCARDRGYVTKNLGSRMTGETREVAERVAVTVRELGRFSCLLFGGETTVNLGDHPGKGGRNQELVLALALQLRDRGEITILSAGTDGEDGPTDAAGAVWDEAVAQADARLGIDPAAFLGRHDSYTFFEMTGGLLKTGLTGTNVMDVCVILTGGL